MTAMPSLLKNQELFVQIFDPHEQMQFPFAGLVRLGSAIDIFVVFPSGSVNIIGFAHCQFSLSTNRKIRGFALERSLSRFQKSQYRLVILPELGRQLGLICFQSRVARDSTRGIRFV